MVERCTKRMESASRSRYKIADECQVIGWREWISLPSLNIDRIKAKIDTGARTSALHAYDVRKFIDRGSPHVSFVLHPAQRSLSPAIDCTAEIRDERLVRSSSGHEEHRFVIEVEAGLGNVLWPIELTLTDRDQMGFRMLLGREAIRRQFLIDPHRSFLIGRAFADVTTISLKPRD